MNSSPGLKSEDTVQIEAKKKGDAQLHSGFPSASGNRGATFSSKSLFDESVTDVTAGSSIICLCFICYSEFRGGPCRLAPLLTPAALLGASAQLHGALVWGRGGHQHGTADSPQLRGESAETVLLVGHRLLLHYLPSFRHLLEHICL